jgi:GT2 family glycosyltransferase
MTGARCDFLANSMDLSICIITHSQPVLLPQCVAACISEIGRSQLAAEIIIVDNASSDRYPERLAAVSPMIRIIRSEENLGFGTANNNAVRMSSGRHVLILNDDAILQEGSLGLMILALQSDPRIGAVGPNLLNPDGSLQRLGMNKRLPHLRGVVCEFLRLDEVLRQNRWARDWLTLWDHPGKSAEPDQVAGACLLARRQALDEVGRFDEGFYYVLEDADLCYRLRKAGWRIVCTQRAQVTHYGSATYSKWTGFSQTANHFRSVSYFFKKYSSPPKYLLVRLTLGLVLLIRMCHRALSGIMRRRFTCEEMGHKVHVNLKLLRSILRADTGHETHDASIRG